ncbi:MAG TPA: hypothetical protein VMT03_21685 [Polyangia bacterium]|nr:hypothetical protein [Polyangia bacterium]
MTFAWVAFGFYAALAVAAGLGFWVGLRAQDDPIDRARATTWQTALLALCGLLIGFTFSMAESRFARRKQFLAEEANAIGTTYLRTRMLDDPAGESMRALLRRYVDARLEFVNSAADDRRGSQALRRSSDLENQMWSLVVAAGRAEVRPHMTSLLVQATNQMFDAASIHQAAVESPMPLTVFLVLMLATAAATASIGYACGLEKRPSAHGMIIMPLLLGTVILLVFDLGHPRVGIVRVGDPILVHLKESL